MQLSKLLADDDAVSPVIGVILMVAITVILAAVIASFVMGLGPGDAAPTASFDFEMQDNGDIEITHAQGDKLDPDAIHIRGDVSTSQTWQDATTSTTLGEIASGTSVTVTPDPSSGGTIRIVWESADSSQTIDQHDY